MSWFCAILAAMSIWQYPALQPRHEALRARYLAAFKAGDRDTMTSIAKAGVKLLPDDPTWRYNYACGLSRTDREAAFDELDTAIDLGFRNVKMIAADPDWKPFAEDPRFREELEYARMQADRAILRGPLAFVKYTGDFGADAVLSGVNFTWDLEDGLFHAHMELAGGEGPYRGLLYMNRDANHSPLKVADFPGLTQVKLDNEGTASGQGNDLPNMWFPYPVFGNASRAYVGGDFWRSIPRAAVTTQGRRLKSLARLYFANQLWFFPAHADCPPVGTHGDVFASVTPYWWISAGSSWTDQPFLRMALKAAAALPEATRKSAIARGILAPTVYTLMRKAAKGVAGEADYFSAAAHSTAFAAGSVEEPRLLKAAAALQPEAIPPVAVIANVAADRPQTNAAPEFTYATPCAWAVVLRESATNRVFEVRARGAEEFHFAAVHDEKGAAVLKSTATNGVRIELDRTKMSTTNRVDVAIFGRMKGTGWGAPAYISFAVVDPAAEYSDPYLGK